jgi:hypothetical protein
MWMNSNEWASSNEASEERADSICGTSLEAIPKTISLSDGDEQPWDTQGLLTASPVVNLLFFYYLLIYLYFIAMFAFLSLWPFEFQFWLNFSTIRIRQPLFMHSFMISRFFWIFW